MPRPIRIANGFEKMGVLMITSFRVLLLAAATLKVCGALDAAFDARFHTIAQAATRSQLYEFFHQMPKGGILHLHSEYAVPPEFWFRIATQGKTGRANEYYTKAFEKVCSGSTTTQLSFATVQRATWQGLSTCEKQNFKLLTLLSPSEQTAWMNAMRVTTATGGRNKFFNEIVPRLSDLCQDPNLMLEVIPEIMRRAASEHIDYLELQFDPTSLRNAIGNRVNSGEFIQLLRKRLTEPDVVSSGVAVRFQMAAYRLAADPEREMSNAFQFVSEHRDLWVGVNLLGQEGQPNGELSRFTSALIGLRSRYDTPLSLHAGELDAPGHQVHDALVAGASRIGHAVNLASDPDTILLMRHGDFPIETSLVSNELLEFTPDLSKHPFPLYLRSGIPMCLNTDDPGAFGGTLTDEFFLAATTYNLNWHELVGLARNSIHYAFVDEVTKAHLAAKLDGDLFTFEQRMSNDNWQARLSRQPHLSDFAKRHLFAVEK